MSKKPLRDQIAAYLATVEEATAAQIAKHTSEKDYPSRVLNELNKMRTDALVETGKKGRDLSYWLASAPEPSAPAEIPTRTTEGADQRRRIIRAAIAGKTPHNGPSLKDLASACGITGQAVENLVGPMISAGTVGKARAEGERFQRFFDTRTQAIAPPQPEAGHNTGSDGSAVIVPDASTEAVAVQEAAAVKDSLTVAEDVNAGDSEGGETDVSATKPRIESGDDFETRAVKLAVRNHNEREELARKYAAKDDELLEQARVVVSLRAELANTRADGEQAVDVLDAAHGYLVKAPKRKPRFLTQPDAARNAAMACARNGSRRGDVYALVHVGTAKRGAEWTEPN